MSSQTDKFRKTFKENIDSHLTDLFEFLKFQSISADPAFEKDVLDCADWVEKFLKDSALKVERWETSGYPVIFAEYDGAGPDKPTLMIYNHYDVQPVDPLELWESPPFEPVVRDGEVYSRGATDNKGQAFFVFAAIKELLKANGELPVNLKLFIEGEEESGSGSMDEILESKKDRLKSDYVLIVDVGIHGMDRPSVIVGTRGIITMELTLRGSNADLHSGVFGGLAYNPNHALVEILSAMRNEKGEIQIPGFYDGVESLSEDEKELVSFDFNPEEFKSLLGLECTGGERNFQPLESAWLRPTLEINGISGGYSGEGFKTVIPAEAVAKISCRLSPGQKVKDIKKKIEDFVSERTPEGITSELLVFGGSGEAARTSPKSRIVELCQQSVAEVFDKDCRIVMEGASIPVGPSLTSAAGGELAFLGFILPGDQMHAPNEHFGVERLEIGFATIARLLELLGEQS